MNNALTETARTHLEKNAEFLFGKTEAKEFVSRLEQRLTQFLKKNGAPGTRRTALPVSERDALLITYADQISETGQNPLQTLDAVAQKYLSGVVSGIHLLPFFPWSSDDGFSVKDYFAIDPALGDWNDVREMGKHFDLMFDAVFNHMSSQSEWFQKFLCDDPQFRDFFVTVEGNPDLSQVVRPRALPLLTEFEGANGPREVWTTFSADQVDLNFKNPRVLLAMLDALLFYVENGAKFIRLDAIAFLWKEIGTRCIHLPQTHRVIQLMRAVLDEAAPNVLLITETNVPHADNISYFGDGANEAQLVYNFALPPLVLHSLTTGNAEKLTGWAQSLKLPSDRVTFFNFLASHDGIGLNPARGILSDDEIEALVARTLEHGGFISYKNNPDGTRSPYEMNINYFDALSNPVSDEPRELQVQRFLCAQAIMLALAGVPGIYFHSLFGSQGDRAAAESSGIPRRINRAKLTREELETELQNPNTRRALVFGAMQKMLRARAAEPLFNPAAPQRILDLAPEVFASERTGAEGTRLVCVHNVSANPAFIPLSQLEIESPDACHLLSGARTWISAEGKLFLPPFGFFWANVK